MTLTEEEIIEIESFVSESGRQRKENYCPICGQPPFLATKQQYAESLRRHFQ